MKSEIFANYVFMLWYICLHIIADCDKKEDHYLKNIPSIFPSRLNPPGLKAPEKLWWAKELTPDFHVCGRLSRHELKSAVDAGFKSILSLFTYPDGDPEGSFGGESLPITETEQKIVEETLGLQFVNLLKPLDEWASVETVQKFTAIVPHLNTPALLHCDRGYTISFVTLLYLANQSRFDLHFKPKINSQRFYEITHSLGMDFFSRIPMEVVEEVTGEHPPSGDDLQRLRSDYEPVDWLDYWYAHPVYKNWFIAGQIYKTHLGPLSDFGYKSVINLRLGLTYKGTRSQEEVNLLNIKSNTGTYGDSSTLPRQNLERLTKTRIDFGRRNSFISNSSNRNFEIQNPNEFGDIIGYNEQLERVFFESSDLEYFHLPLKSIDDLRQFFKENKEKLLNVGKKGPVLVHCSDGSRSAYVAVLMAAMQYKLSLDWALQRLKETGFGVASDKEPSVFRLYQDLLLSQTIPVSSQGRFNEL